MTSLDLVSLWLDDKDIKHMHSRTPSGLEFISVKWCEYCDIDYDLALYVPTHDKSKILTMFLHVHDDRKCVPMESYNMSDPKTFDKILDFLSPTQHRCKEYLTSTDRELDSHSESEEI